MLNWLELIINRYCCNWLVAHIICINDARSNKYQISKDYSAFETPGIILPMTQRIIPEDISSVAVSSLNIALFYVMSPPWLSHTLRQLCEILCFVDCACLYNLVNKINLVYNLFLVLVYLSTSGKQGGIPPCLSDSHPYRITSTKCRKAVLSHDDGHTVARNL